MCHRVWVSARRPQRQRGGGRTKDGKIGPSRSVARGSGFGEARRESHTRTQTRRKQQYASRASQTELRSNLARRSACRVSPIRRWRSSSCLDAGTGTTPQQCPTYCQQPADCPTGLTCNPAADAGADAGTVCGPPPERLHIVSDNGFFTQLYVFNANQATYQASFCIDLICDPDGSGFAQQVPECVWSGSNAASGESADQFNFLVTCQRDPNSPGIHATMTLVGYQNCSSNLSWENQAQWEVDVTPTEPATNNVSPAVCFDPGDWCISCPDPCTRNKGQVTATYSVIQSN